MSLAEPLMRYGKRLASPTGLATRSWAVMVIASSPLAQSLKWKPFVDKFLLGDQEANTRVNKHHEAVNISDK